MKYKQITVLASGKSGAEFRVDSFKYRIVSTTKVGKRKMESGGFLYKYRIKFTERNKMIRKNGWIGTNDKKLAIKDSGDGMITISKIKLLEDGYDKIIVRKDDLLELLKCR